MTRNLGFSRDYLEALNGVSADDISRVLKTYFDDRNLTITSLNPQGSLTGEIAEAKPVVAAEIQQFKLTNGLRLLVREDARLPLISIVTAFRAGLRAETAENNGPTTL